MSVTVKFDYSLGEPVVLRPLGKIQGVVDGLFADAGGEQYRVVYWSEGDRKSALLYPWEIDHRAQS